MRNIIYKDVGDMSRHQVKELAKELMEVMLFSAWLKVFTSHFKSYIKLRIVN